MKDNKKEVEIYRKAPRFRQGYTCTVTKKMFDEFIEKNPKYKYAKDKYKEYLDLLIKFNEMLASRIYENPAGIKLPRRIGNIILLRMKVNFGKEIKEKYFDYAYYNKTGIKRKMYWETEDYRMRLAYFADNTKYSPLLMTAYTFFPNRDLFLTCKKEFKSNYEKYFLAHTVKEMRKFVFKNNASEI